MTRSTRWLQCRPTAIPPRMRLFCLPHAGGGATTFRNWPAALPQEVQVCCVLLPGREARRSDPPFTQFGALVDEITNELNPWLDLPFLVFGHSMGSLLAFEWVRRLQCQGKAMPGWLFLSGRAAPDTIDPGRRLHGLPDREFLQQLTEIYQGIPQEILRDPELLEVFLPILRADISIVESYRFQRNEALRCPITVFAGANDTSVTGEQILAWKRQTSERFAMRYLPGGHFYPHEPLLQSIKATLAGLLA